MTPQVVVGSQYHLQYHHLLGEHRYHLLLEPVTHLQHQLHLQVFQHLRLLLYLPQCQALCSHQLYLSHLWPAPAAGSQA